MYVPAKRSSSLPILSAKHDIHDDGGFPFSDIIVQQESQDAVTFNLYSEVGDSLESEYPAPYLLPIFWEFWGIPDDCEDSVYEAIDNDDYTNCVKLGTISGHLILCCQMIMDGYDPLTVCDDESGDLECIMSILSSEGGPLNDLTGDSMQDVFYIHELTIEEPLRRQGIGTRLLQELPYLSKRLLHLEPDILAYYVASVQADQDENTNENESIDSFYSQNQEDTQFFEFYQSNGFQKLGDSRLLYTFTDM